MKNKMLNDMAMDLGIAKYESETDIQYCHRILYSATACWVKAASMDHPLTDDTKTPSGVSRRHINDKCSAVLEEMLKRYPYCKAWFDTNIPTENSVAVIRSRLLRHGDLVNIGFNTNIALSVQSDVRLTQQLECIKGIVLQTGIPYSGVATINLAPCSKDFIFETVEPSIDWIAQYVKRAWWRKTDLSHEDIQYFDPYRKSFNNQSWQSSLPHTVNAIVLARRSVNKNAYEYLLYKPNEHIAHRIDPFLQEQREYRRFMIGMRTLAGNPVLARVTRYSDHITLRLRIHLPTKEHTLLESYSWPQKSIVDKLAWNMPVSVWGYIEQQMIALGLEITEETYG